MSNRSTIFGQHILLSDTLHILLLTLYESTFLFERANLRLDPLKERVIHQQNVQKPSLVTARSLACCFVIITAAVSNAKARRAFHFAAATRV